MYFHEHFCFMFNFCSVKYDAGSYVYYSIQNANLHIFTIFLKRMGFETGFNT